jgi:hypothetical protein
MLLNTAGNSTANMIFSTGSGTTERMRITSAGAVLVGATTAVNSSKFLVAGVSSANSPVIQGSASAGAYLNFFNNAQTTGSIQLGQGLGSGSDNVGILYNNANAAFVFGTNGSERMRIDSSGNLLVGQTTTNFANSRSFVLDVGAGAVYVSHANGDASGNYFAGFGYNGSAIGSITQSGTTAVLYNLTSDQRLKENIVDAPSGNIDDIKVRSFDWKSDGSHVNYGFIAQELVNVAPYAVHQPKDSEEMMAVDYSKLVPMMIKEIQDLKQRILTLENK